MNSRQKTVLVTGGSRGIGLAIVEAFRAAGWRVAACARERAHLDACPADVRFACDISDVDAVRAGIRGVIAELGTLDALVNNAGIAGTNPLGADSDDTLRHRIIGVNLHGTYYVTKHAFGHLRDGGRIVNIGSVLSHSGVADQSAYTAAKHAVLGFTRAFARHAAPRGITVNCICPGWVATDMARARWQALGIDEAVASAESPLGRVTTPAEVAALVLYLVSDEARAITGQSFTIDGGMLG
jgi:NAD(P)-dependent dehydrogenase (short-subunit alcohol dehydrogenase family)